MVTGAFRALYCTLLAAASVTAMTMMLGDILFRIDGNMEVWFAALFLFGWLIALATGSLWSVAGGVIVAPIGLIVSKLGFFILLGVPLILAIFYHYGFFGGSIISAALLAPGAEPRL